LLTVLSHDNEWKKIGIQKWRRASFSIQVLHYTSIPQNCTHTAGRVKCGESIWHITFRTFRTTHSHSFIYFPFNVIIMCSLTHTNFLMCMWFFCGNIKVCGCDVSTIKKEKVKTSQASDEQQTGVWESLSMYHIQWYLYVCVVCNLGSHSTWYTCFFPLPN